VFAAANLALCFASVSAALAFYGCARWLRARWEWAFAAALLFAFTFQTFHRGLPHLFFVFSWTVPLGLLAAALVASSRRMTFPGWGAAFCLLTALVIGVGNPYVLYLFLQLVGWAVIAQWLGARRRDNLVVGLTTIALALLGFLVVESHIWLFAPDTAANSPLVRNYGGTEFYALKPLELFLPPSGHRWEAFSFFGHRYLRWSAWRGGEAFFPYLGLVGIAGFIWLAVAALQALLRRERLPSPALPAGWILAFSSMGGLTNIVAFFTGLLVFRATNRFSVFLSAIVLMFIASRMTRWWANRSPVLSIAAAALVAIVGLVDQLPPPPGLEKQQRIARRVAADRELARILEENLKPNAMVFQLPVMMFPEAPPAFQLGDYEHFRPYLVSRSLRFSYGMLRGRSRGRWQRDAETLPTADFVRKIERYGFSALYFNRRGFADGGQKLLRELEQMGRARKFEGAAGEQVVVLLNPSPTPTMPMARSLTFGRGWHTAQPNQPRWAYGPATLSYFNPHSKPMTTRLRLTMSGVGPRNVRIRINQGEEVSAAVDSSPNVVDVPVVLQPGFNRLDMEAQEPAVRLNQESGSLRSFALHEAIVMADEVMANL
jgi:phosphoglycerol transferase